MKASVEPYRCTLGFRGLAVEVCSNVSAPLRWLEEFMSPGLRNEESFDARREIRLIVDDERYARMLRLAGPEPQEWVDCFTKEGSFEKFSVWRDEQGKEILYSAMEECFLIPEQKGAEIELIASADHGNMRRCLMRLVRELAMIQAMYRGDVFIHGAAVVCREEAIIVTGARRSGKTTTLINALRQGDARYLANDRVFVGRSENVFQARGMPTIVAIRPDCLGHLPGLKLPEWGHPWRHYLTMQECEEKSPLIKPAFQEPPAMNPPQFCRWLRVEMAAKAPLRAVVFPQIDPSVTSYSLQRVNSVDGETLLCSNLFSSGQAGPVAKAFAHGWQGAAPSLQGMKDGCREISKLCALFTCRLGPAAFKSPNAWNAIVSAAFERQ